MSGFTVNPCDEQDERAGAGVPEPVIQLHRAQGLGARVVSPILIEIGEEFPNGLKPELAMQLHRMNAEFLEEALHQALPGGTYDALLHAMLVRKASHFVVSFANGEKQ